MYRYRVKYRDISDASCRGVWFCWAYDVQHALDQFYSGPDAGGRTHTDEPSRVREKRNRI